jgi:hypothetical protein
LKNYVDVFSDLEVGVLEKIYNLVG